MTIDTSPSLATARAHYKVTFAVLLIGITAYGLLQSLILPVLPTIQHDLHTSQSTVTWVLTAYLLTASIFTPILGRLGDMFGKKLLLVVALVILGVGTVVAALSTSIGVLIVACAIQGVGGGVLPLAFGIIRGEFPPAKVSTGVGFTAAIVAVAAGAGIVLAGPIVSHLNYHWLFWIPLFMIAVGAVATHFSSPSRLSATRAGSVGPQPSSSRGGWWHCCWPSARGHRGGGLRRPWSAWLSPRWCWPPGGSRSSSGRANHWSTCA